MKGHRGKNYTRRKPQYSLVEIQVQKGRERSLSYRAFKLLIVMKNIWGFQLCLESQGCRPLKELRIWFGIVYIIGR